LNSQEQKEGWLSGAAVRKDGESLFNEDDISVLQAEEFWEWLMGTKAQQSSCS
jgi:hypothetical protein